MTIKQIVKKEIYRIGFLVETHGGEAMPVYAHNIASQFTNRQLHITTNKKGKSVEKLSSGYKINRSADDAAGLQISEKMRSQIRGLNQASRNIQDGVSLCQVADGALGEVHDILQRMNELSVQAANDTNTIKDRQAIQNELDELRNEVARISLDTTYNAMPVFMEDLTKITSSNNSSTAEINNINLQLPQGIEKTINAANINTALTQNADGTFELEDGVIYTISSDVKNVAFHLSMGNTASIKNSKLEMCSVVCDNAYLYLSDVSIDNTTLSTAPLSGWEGAPISCKGNAQINFIGTNTLAGGRYRDVVSNVKDYAAIEVLDGEAVELNGNGKLICKGGDSAAGIGGNYITDEIDAGKIVINSGSVYAYSDIGLGAGIGGAYEGNGGNVIVNGGYVYANGNGSGAGIGSGAIISSSVYTDGGRVEINGGVVYAESTGIDEGAAGIGGGFGSNGADVIITGGDVYANGNRGGAGIGSGINMDFKNIDSGNVTISSGKVIAVGSKSGLTGYAENVWEGSAIGQGAMHGDATILQNWENGFGTTTIDGIVVDTKTIGRDVNSIIGGNYIFTYNTSYNPPSNPSGTVSGVQKNPEKGNWWIQMGANAGNGMFVSVGSLQEAKQQIENVNVLSNLTVGDAIESVQKAIDLVSRQRTMIGAQQNRLEFAKIVDNNTAENTQHAESRIRDTDMAKEMVEYSKNNILEQVGQSMLAQANQSTQGILSLLS